MDELGSAPRIQFGDKDQYTTDVDQNGSWFGLAISGLKFLINNQHNNSINHNLNPLQSSGTNNDNPNLPSSTSSNSNSAKSTNYSSKKLSENNGNTQKPKLHILGPSVFKKQLYDIPEYQSTSDKNKGNKRKRSIRTSSKLTKQALAQFNGNFTNYWNQRSSLHSHYGSSNGDHADDDMTSNAGSHHTNQSHGNYTNNTKASHGALTDGGSSTIQHEHNPSMTSSQIIHPTQDKPPKLILNHSRSFPLLHSAEYIQDFQKFTFTEDKDIDNDMEGIMNIPSPPPVSTTPDINSSIILPKLKNVHPIKSWESVNSSNIGSVKSFPDDNSTENGMQAFADGKLLTSGPGQITPSLTQLIVSDNHFIKEKQQSSVTQKQWLRKNLSAMKSKRGTNNHGSVDSSFSGSTATNTAGLVHVHQDGCKIQSEIDWAECHDTTIGQVISNPIPKSIKKSKNKNKKKKYKDTQSNGNDSDWSQVSSNMGVTTPALTQQ